MAGTNDLSRCSVALAEDSTLIAVVEMGATGWLVAGRLPGIDRDRLQRLPVDEEGLLAVLHRWRDRAERAGRPIGRVCVAYEAGRDGFWLARWLVGRGVEAHVMHATSVPGEAGPPSGEDGPAGLRSSDARFCRLAARRGGALPDGGGSLACRRGCASGASRARQAGRRARPDRQPAALEPGPARHPGLQPEAAWGGGAACRAAHAGGRADPAQRAGRAAPAPWRG